MRQYIGQDWYGYPVCVGDVVRDARPYGRDILCRVGRATMTDVIWYGDDAQTWEQVGTSNVVKI